MLQKCRQKLRRQPEEIQNRVRLLEGNMTEFQTGESFSLITVPFRPFQHLITVKEQRACLDCIRQHLEPGGILVLDLFHCYPPSMYDPKYWVEQPVAHDLLMENDLKVTCTTRIADFHQDAQYNDIEIIYYVTSPNGDEERLVQAFPFRYFSDSRSNIF